VIATPRGERLVEDLKQGDRVITRDNGIQEIAWTGSKALTGHQLARMPHLRPILIQAGALGNGLPEQDLMVSPNHRVLVANDRTSLYFDESEVLVAAKHLTGLAGVDEVTRLGATYVHFMFERHEVVLSNGAWTESFQPGDHSLKGIGAAQRGEILELFPELEAEGTVGAGFESARRVLKKHEAQLIAR
uniref:Hint domain-containing protein n=1 Tax=Rhodosalinus sp. TaxID=2047741 RepID=UPI0035676FD9